MVRLTVVAFLFSFALHAKDPYSKNENIDIKQYRFQLELNDSTDQIKGRATITILFKKPILEFELDLMSRDQRGQGMTVKTITSQENNLYFTHQKNRLVIQLSSPVSAGETRTFDISYSGFPREGLIISTNKFGDRTFFGDNWPDRGHHWLPCIDHPFDKAPVEFIVIAPEHYQVVATGKLMEESNLPDHRKLTHWKERTDVAVKVMTIGVSRFAVQLSAEIENTPISTWVFPQNREEGFIDFAVAPKIFKYFQQYIGPYSFEKLAHVQSKTRFGGLENAGNIFYSESSVTGQKENEELIAHETAHQWFGNSATENDWHHVWLSEGFATYFAHLYLEDAYGHDRLATEMKIDRQQVIDFYKENQAPVVDTTVTFLDDVLNNNTYQKASWVLHMLRQEIGDKAFHQSIRDYYSTYRNKNVMTADFQRIAEKNSGKKLVTFFDQWIFKGGHPKITGTWTYDSKTKEIVIEVSQIQAENPFSIIMELGLKQPNGQMTTKQANLNSRKQQIRWSFPIKPTEIVLDPQTRLLFEGTIREN
jgi:aminopeptidase N